ncbi:MAG: hypothetical protein LBU82_06675 [Treponema sp.]|nr:hypothetical protein [Treponema sp.]
MLIKYKPDADRLKYVSLIPVTEDQKKIKLSRGQVQLLPGVNEVTDDEWEIMKQHLAYEIKSGEIRTIEMAAASGKGSGGKARNLKDAEVKEAVAMIEECVNPDTLKKWHSEETRDAVVRCILERMKEIKMEVPKFDSSKIAGAA